MLLMLYLDRRLWKNVPPFPRNSALGVLVLWIIPLLWHPLVQSQGFNRGIALVLHKLISSVDANDECIDLLYQAWYLNDGALAGNHSASCVLRAMDIMGPALVMDIIEEMGPALGLCIKFAKCELFSSKGNATFPPAVKCSLLPNLDILGTPVGDYLHCSRFITEKCCEKLLASLVDVKGVQSPGGVHITAHVWRFCKLVHLTWITPPSLASNALVSVDEDVRQCFVLCSAIEISDTVETGSA